MSGSHRQNRVTSDFSIAKILSDDLTSKNNTKNINNYIIYHNNSTQINNDEKKHCNNYIIDDKAGTSDNVNVDYQKVVVNDFNKIENLHWLQCTRYKPPKLPRNTMTVKNIKRKPAKHPRIPFTNLQLQILEKQYNNKAYLMRKDVQQLSNQLKLPQSRVKIWFQNRRARDRRDNKIVDN
ncbi:homeobox protein MSX-1, partial [Aphidius gifuensis]|uniref:homeobox protein MSX-1 n=1 Tax=Aphidius gifuensis TaxID=684658 RepID=UPI001CDBCF12